MNETELNNLKTALKNEDYQVRREAIGKLNCSIHNKEKTIEKDQRYEKVIPILTAALTDSDGYVGVLAAQALVGIDRNFKQACAFTIVKTLIEIIATKQDELVDEEDDDIDCGDLTVGESAGYTLFDIAGLASSAAPEIIQLFTNSDPQYRKAVCCALSSMGYGNGTAFTQALADKNKLVRLGVLDVISVLIEYEDLYDEEMQWVVPALEKATEDENKQVRSTASRLLKSI